MKNAFTGLVAGYLIFGGLLSLVTKAGTKVDLKHQSRNAKDLIQPGVGTIVVCVGDASCEALPDGSWVLYRTIPPKEPGLCRSEGTGAIAFDEHGYLYVCSAPWAREKGQMYWMRSQQPFVSDWTPDRDPSAPSLPQK